MGHGGGDPVISALKGDHPHSPEHTRVGITIISSLKTQPCTLERYWESFGHQKKLCH